MKVHVVLLTVADSGFPRELASISGDPNLLFGIVSPRKVHGNEKNWTRGRIPRAPRSVTEI